MGRPSKRQANEQADLRRAATPVGDLSKAVMRTLAEESPDAIVVVDVQGRVAWVSRQLEQLFGYGRAELLGQPVEHLLPDTLQTIHMAHRASFMQNPRARPMGVGLDLKAQRHGGATFPVEISLTPLETDSGGMVIATVRDISDRQATAEQQSALRRVATLVAEGVPPEDVFAAVTAEVGRVLGVDYTAMSRYHAEGARTVVAAWARSGSPVVPVGTREILGGPNVPTLVFETGRPARIDRYGKDAGPAAAAAVAAGVRSAIGVPIRVEGQLWGLMNVYSTREERLPESIEGRLAGFTELVATAIANAQAREELRTVADEQAALRRVATLVAQGVTAVEVFTAMASETKRILEFDTATLLRLEPDGMVTVVGSVATLPLLTAVGDRRTPLAGGPVDRVLRTGGPARTDGFEGEPGSPGHELNALGYGGAAAAPIFVEGRLWGVVRAAWSKERSVSPGSEDRLLQFSELIATALANAEAREDLRTIADEQAALRRVAMLVAAGAPPPEVFTAVAEEVGRLLAVAGAFVVRYEADETVTTLATSNATENALPVGLRRPVVETSLSWLVRESGCPARIDYVDDPVALEYGISSSVAAPITVEGRLWGYIAASTTHDRPPPETETRLAGFTELAATAIANAESRAQLMASRARIVAASDTARHRFERDLHDGAQQRLVSLGLRLRTAQASVVPGAKKLARQLEDVASEIDEVVDELRGIASGLHPPVLAHGGLKPALSALARRTAIQVHLDVRVDQRLSEEVELAAYYVVSEALANAVKHAAASDVEVDAEVSGGMLVIEIRDDGRGGASFDQGSGLVGLRDRVEALGGQLSVLSPTGVGTTVGIAVPLDNGHETRLFPADHRPPADGGQAANRETSGSPRD